MRNIGKQFEDNIKNSMPKNVYVYRPPDQAQAFNMNNNLRFSRHSPADYFIFDGNRNIFLALECKTFQGSCSIERTKDDKGIIHLYQVESLDKINNYYRAIAGFLLDFRKSGNTYFLSINDYKLLEQNITKKSFNEQDMLKHCSPILLKKRKLKVNYRYDMENLLVELEKQI